MMTDLERFFLVEATMKVVPKTKAELKKDIKKLEEQYEKLLKDNNNPLYVCSNGFIPYKRAIELLKEHLKGDNK